METQNQPCASAQPQAQVVLEMENLPELPKAQMTPFELLTPLSQNDVCEFYPNLWLAARIACTLPVTVASAELFQGLIDQEPLGVLNGPRKTEWTGSRHDHYSEVMSGFASRKTSRKKFVLPCVTFGLFLHYVLLLHSFETKNNTPDDTFTVRTLPTCLFLLISVP